MTYNAMIKISNATNGVIGSLGGVLADRRLSQVRREIVSRRGLGTAQVASASPSVHVYLH